MHTVVREESFGLPPLARACAAGHAVEVEAGQTLPRGIIEDRLGGLTDVHVAGIAPRDGGRRATFLALGPPSDGGSRREVVFGRSSEYDGRQGHVSLGQSHEAVYTRDEIGGREVRAVRFVGAERDDEYGRLQERELADESLGGVLRIGGPVATDGMIDHPGAPIEERESVVTARARD